MMLLQYLPGDKVNTESDNGDTDDNELPKTENVDTDDNGLPAFLYNLKELDLASGIDYCGDAEDYIMALTLYMSSATKKAEEIENYWAEKDIKNTTIKVHGLKSASRLIGALELGDFAEKLEKAGNNGDSEMLEKELDGFLSRYRQLARDLEPLNDLE
jgi:HPt (histidine-containing phosphotransfer) domain-containing protein